MNKKAATDVDRHVGSRLRLRRMLIGMTQETLAAELGVTFQQVQKYERGANRISASRLQEIGEVLGVEPAFFFEDLPQAPARKRPKGTNGHGPALQSMIEFLSTPEGLSLMQAFVAVEDTRVQRAIIGLVAVLAGIRTGVA